MDILEKITAESLRVLLVMKSKLFVASVGVVGRSLKSGEMPQGLPSLMAGLQFVCCSLTSGCRIYVCGVFHGCYPTPSPKLSCTKIKVV